MKTRTLGESTAIRTAFDIRLDVGVPVLTLAIGRNHLLLPREGGRSQKCRRPLQALTGPCEGSNATERFTCSANGRHASGEHWIMAPVRSFVSRTSTRLSSSATSTQFPP